MLTSLQQTWKALTLAQRVGLAGLLCAVFGGILLVAQTAGRPSYAVLFSNLEPQDAGEVTSKLRDLKTDYRLSEGGRAIEVPVDKVYDLRLSLATEGLPRGGGAGFELFDKPNFAATDFTQHLNYQRALQGELTRTINRLEGVVETRVHLALPQPRLFSEKEEPATASVVLHLRPGYTMDERRVAGIVHLVSSAVEGLKPENVTIEDAQGVLLSSGGSPSMLNNDQVQMQDRYERRLETELRRLAEQVVGPGKAAVQVSADLNWDQMETTSETYKPSGSRDKNLIVEEQTTTETYGKRPNLSPSGPAGIASNLDPGAAGRVTVTASGEAGQYLNKHASNQYVVNKVVERRITAPGQIRRLSIAVLLDDSVPSTQQQALRDVFAAAAGIDPTRGDRIELKPMPFDKTHVAEETRTAEAAAKQSFRITLIRNGAAVAIVLLIGISSFLLMTRLRGARRESLDALLAEPLSLPATQAQAHFALGSPAAALPYSSANPGATFPHPGAASAATLAERMRELAAERPEELARQLQTWIAER